MQSVFACAKGACGASRWWAGLSWSVDLLQVGRRGVASAWQQQRHAIVLHPSHARAAFSSPLVLFCLTHMPTAHSLQQDTSGGHPRLPQPHAPPHQHTQGTQLLSFRDPTDASTWRLLGVRSRAATDKPWHERFGRPGPTASPLLVHQCHICFLHQNDPFPASRRPSASTSPTSPTATGCCAWWAPAATRTCSGSCGVRWGRWWRTPAWGCRRGRRRGRNGRCDCWSACMTGGQAADGIIGT